MARCQTYASAYLCEIPEAQEAIDYFFRGPSSDRLKTGLSKPVIKQKNAELIRAHMAHMCNQEDKRRAEVTLAYLEGEISYVTPALKR